MLSWYCNCFKFIVTIKNILKKFSEMFYFVLQCKNFIIQNLQNKVFENNLSLLLYLKMMYLYDISHAMF